MKISVGRWINSFFPMIFRKKINYKKLYSIHATANNTQKDIVGCKWKAISFSECVISIKFQHHFAFFRKANNRAKNRINYPWILFLVVVPTEENGVSELRLSLLSWMKRLLVDRLINGYNE